MTESDTLKTHQVPAGKAHEYEMRWCNTSTYAGIARNAFAAFEESSARIDEIIGRLSQAESDDERIRLESQLVSPEDAKDEQGVITIVFAAFALEAFIYDYAARQLSRSYVETYLDKLSMPAKFVVIPQLLGKQFDPGSHACGCLDKLHKDRNALVHSKSKQLAADEVTPEAIRQRDLGFIDKVKNAIEALNAVADAFNNLDSNSFAHLNLGRLNTWHRKR